MLCPWLTLGAHRPSDRSSEELKEWRLHDVPVGFDPSGFRLHPLPIQDQCPQSYYLSNRQDRSRVDRRH